MFKKKNSLINDEMLPYDFENKQYDESSRRKKFILGVLSCCLVLILAVGVYVFTLFNVKKNYAFVANFIDLPSPIQTETSGEIVTTVDDYDVTFELKAEYKITGLVVEKYYYFPHKIENKLSRFDLGMVWGPLLSEDLDEYISFKNDGNRFLKYRYSNELIARHGSRDAVINSISNNHMIHSSDTVLKYLRNVKEGDYIQVEGYLVYVTMRSKKGVKQWDSSLSRTDHGDGACEIIYVTNITWLKIG